MSLLATINKTKGLRGVRMVVAAGEGVGKTHFAVGAPAALLLPLEDGFAGVSIDKTAMITDYQTLNTAIDEIIKYLMAGTFPYKSLVFDTVTALERHIHADVISSDPNFAKGNAKAITMESALGGYGKAYLNANDKFELLLRKCDYMATTHGINIIMTCQVFATELIDPISGKYDSWDLRLHSPKNNKTFGKREMLREWADIIGYMYEPIIINESNGMSQGISAKRGRVMGFSPNPSYVAKNRYNLPDQIAIPKEQSWNHFAEALYKASGVDVYNRTLA